MFDLDTLEVMNARAVREGQLRREASEAARRQLPIAALAHKLRSGNPPAIYGLVGLFKNAESYQDFVKLVREFLPEREGDILSRDGVGGQVASFASYFEDRYFPLHPHLADGETEEYEQVLGQIPVQVLGMSYDDYHTMEDYRPGIQLMTYLCGDPYNEGEGDRVALADLCRQHIDQAILERVPAAGFSLDELTRLLKKTRFEGLMHWCALLGCSTGNFFLDVDYESLWSGGYDIPWDKEGVEQGKADWLAATKIYDQAYKLAEWLEGGAPGRFEELLNFILAKRDRKRRK